MDAAPSLEEYSQPIAEFKDTPASIQMIEFGICALGGATLFICAKTANGDMGKLWFGGAAVLVAFIATYFVHITYGNKTSLKHVLDGIVLDDRGDNRKIPFDQLTGFSASWTDVYVNNVYSTTNVSLTFDAAGSFKVLKYDSSAKQGTLKYEQLESLQAAMTHAVAERMRNALLTEGFVPWTSQITLTTAGLDIRRGGKLEPEAVPFHRVSRWEVDQGVFKMALDEHRRPSITEKSSQTNFFPGLMLFAELHEEFGKRNEIPPPEQEPEALPDSLFPAQA